VRRGKELGHTKRGPSVRSLTRYGPGWRLIQNISNVNYIHLPSQTLVRGIYAHHPSIPTEARMQINPVFSLKIGNVLCC
jgi:hypothetical protein